MSCSSIQAHKTNTQTQHLKEEETITKENLKSLQGAIDVYESLHEGKFPARLKDVLRLDEMGPKYTTIPPEEITHSNRISSVMNGTGGWFYDPITGKVNLNIFGSDSSNTPYKNYSLE